MASVFSQVRVFDSAAACPGAAPVRSVFLPRAAAGGGCGLARPLPPRPPAPGVRGGGDGGAPARAAAGASTAGKAGPGAVRDVPFGVSTRAGRTRYEPGTQSPGRIARSAMNPRPRRAGAVRRIGIPIPYYRVTRASRARACGRGPRAVCALAAARHGARSTVRRGAGGVSVPARQVRESQLALLKVV